MMRDEIKLMLGIKELYSVTREQLREDFEAVLDRIDAGCNPVLIAAEGKPGFPMYNWEDDKRRFGAVYPSEKFEQIEEELRRYEKIQ